MLAFETNGIPSSIATPLGITVAVTGCLSFIVAASAFVKAVLEYERQNSLKRFEKYQEMFARYSDRSFEGIRRALGEGGQKLADYNTEEKYEFMNFFEDVALMYQSKLMRIEVAAYMLGYDARTASTDPNFPVNLHLGKEDPNWTLFWNFCQRLNAYIDSLTKHCTGLDGASVRKVDWPVETFRF